MAESTLSMKFSTLYGKVGQRAYGVLPASLTAPNIVEAKRWVNEGYRNFLASADWGFLYADAAITVWPAVTGTVVTQGAYTAPSTVCTATAAKFYASMVGQPLTFDTSETDYVIDGYTNTKVISLRGNASGELTDDTFTITPVGDYGLPDDYGQLIGTFNHAANTGLPKLRPSTPDEIRALRALAQTGADPQIYALKPRDFLEDLGQRWDLMLWPTPSAARVLTYQYRRNPALMDGDADYPVGAGAHGATILQFALAAWEQDIHRVEGMEHARLYGTGPTRPGLLVASLQIDARQRNQNLGYIQSGSPPAEGRNTPMDHDSGLTIT